MCIGNKHPSFKERIFFRAGKTNKAEKRIILEYVRYDFLFKLCFLHKNVKKKQDFFFCLNQEEEEGLRVM